jgi:hypothetical protein
MSQTGESDPIRPNLPAIANFSRAAIAKHSLGNLRDFIQLLTGLGSRRA